jgi:RNAse (barnase) inhibitor barstar
MELKNNMRVAIVGSRSFTDYEKFKTLLFNAYDIKDISEIVSGGAKGTDSLAEKFSHEYMIPIKIFFPDWNKFGKKAGFLRNEEIVDYCDELVAFWDGDSKGTKSSIDLSNKKDKPNTIYFV